MIQRTKEELLGIWDELESQRLNNYNEYQNKQITFTQYRHKDWTMTQKKTQILSQICLIDNVDKEFIDYYIFNTIVWSEVDLI